MYPNERHALDIFLVWGLWHYTATALLFYFILPYADNFSCAHKNIESFTKQNLMFQVGLSFKMLNFIYIVPDSERSYVFVCFLLHI